MARAARTVVRLPRVFWTISNSILMHEDMESGQTMAQTSKSLQQGSRESTMRLYPELKC